MIDWCKIFGHKYQQYTRWMPVQIPNEANQLTSYWQRVAICARCQTRKATNIPFHYGIPKE